MLLNKFAYNELVKKVNTTDFKVSTSELLSERLYNSDKQKLEVKIEDVDKETSDTSKLINTQNINRLTKINVTTEM